MIQNYTIKYEIQYHSGENTYTFVFGLANQEIAPTQSIHDSEINSSVSCIIYRTDQQDQFWTYEGLLDTDTEVPFGLTYEDSVNIQGSIKLFHSNYSLINYVFMDATIGVEYEEHFEGNVAAIDNVI